MIAFRNCSLVRGILLVFGSLLCSISPAWAEPTSGEPAAQSFDVFAGDANATNKGGGIVGSGGYYYSVVTIGPRWELSDGSTLKITLDGKRVTKKEVQRQNARGLGAISWGITLMDMDHPEGLVREVTASFDLKPGAATPSTAVTAAKADGGTFTIEIPKDASRLKQIDVRWMWNEKNDKTLQFAAAAELKPADRFKFTIVGKSSIAALKELPRFEADKYVSGDLGTFGKGAESTATLSDWIAFAKEVNEKFSEDPLTKPAANPALDRRDSLNGQYRLYSRQVISFECTNRDGKWKVAKLKWEKGQEEADPGLERLSDFAALIPPDLSWFSAPLQQKQWYLRDDGNWDAAGNQTEEFDEVAFQYAVRGRPNAAANQYMEHLFGSRTHADPWVGNDAHPTLVEYSYIAHAIAFKLGCATGKGTLAATISGTHFPTHHLFVNGKHSKTVAQDKFHFLWSPEYRQGFRNLGLIAFRDDIMVP